MIQVGLQIYGPGKVWFDDVRATYVGNESASASTVKEDTTNLQQLINDAKPKAMPEIGGMNQASTFPKSESSHIISNPGIFCADGVGC